MNSLLAQFGLPGMWLLTSPWMLFWAVAAVVPVLIHLWSRRKYDEVPWAAMRFLLAAIRKNARRWRIEQLVLLALRMLIVILLAIALADPIVALLGDDATGGGRSGDTHTVLVLDASYSMDYRRTDATRFQTAKELASELVRQSMQGDGFTLISLADPPSVLVREPVFDRESMVAEIAQLRRTDGGADLTATLAEVERVLDRTSARESRLRRHRICFFTDLGRNTWGDVANDDAQTTLHRLAGKAEMKLFDVGQSGGQNVALTRLSATVGVATVGAPMQLKIEIENVGNQDRKQQTIQLLVDGQKISELEADVLAGDRASLSMVHRFQTPGEHVVEARLPDDHLQADNRRWLSMRVRAALEVLCVEGKSGAARNIALALEPSTTLQTHVRPVVRSEIALLEEDLARYDCIFLCNVGRFGSDEAHLLRRFLERGGGVVMFLGDQVQGDNYNSILGPDAGADRCLLTRLDAPVTLGEYRFDPLDYQHPIVEPFRGHERAGLLTTPVWKYVQVTLDATTPATMALAFQNGAPAIVEESIGNGRVILVTTDASVVSLDRSTDPPTPWSALAAWPSFPPLVQQLLRSAVRGRSLLRNVQVGDALHGTLPAGSSATSVLVEDPAGRRQRVPVKVAGDLIQWTYTETSLGGLYGVANETSPDQRQQFAVNLDTTESHLDRFDAELLPRSLQHETAEGDQETIKVEVAKPVPFFRYVLAALLVLLLGETFLAWFFGRAAA